MDVPADFGTFNAYVLVGLIVLFAGILYWAFRPKNRHRFESDAQIPFHDDEGSGKGGTRP